MVNDYIAFMPNKRNLTIGLLDGSDCNITVALNLSTEIYCKIISGVSALNSVNDNEKLDIVIDLVYEILNSYHTYDTEIKFIDYKSKEWITKNVPMQNMMDIITVVMQEINHILENDCFNIPDVHVTKKTGTIDKDTEKTKQKIEQLENYLRKQNRLENSLMDDIAMVTARTSNSYHDIMRMPIFAFRNLARTIVFDDLKANDDWKLAYLNKEIRTYENELNSGKAIDSAPKKKIKAEIDKFDNLFG